MAKVKGPCLSMAASGTLAGAIVFRATARGPQVQRTPRQSRPASPAQQVERDDFTAAAVYWRTLGAAAVEEWTEAAQIRQRTPRTFFIAEWRIQRATEDNPPLVPAPNF